MIYVNSKNDAFARIVSKKYVDKTDLISFFNDCINSDDPFYCLVRPRRFGKTITANMLTAYYSKGCDSSELFKNFKISKSPDYKKHLNKYDTISFNMNSFMVVKDENGDQFLDNLISTLCNDLKETYQEVFRDFPCKDNDLLGMLSTVAAVKSTQFVFIIDEWDLVFRKYPNNTQLQNDFITLLTLLFKSNFGESNIALAYMTGILPIKRYCNQSELNNFSEITMLNSFGLGEYMGFTEKEVQSICDKYALDFVRTKEWYDGYIVDGVEIYNPYAIIALTKSKEYLSSWSGTASSKAIAELIEVNYEGLREDLARLISGQKLEFTVASKSSNALFNLNSKVSIFTCLIYLGYLGYDKEQGCIFIPNKDVRLEIEEVFLGTTVSDDNDIVKLSKKLFESLLNYDQKAVAGLIEQIHNSFASINGYNNEESLRGIMSMAMVWAYRYYSKPFFELPSGKGFSDLVFLPLKGKLDNRPAIIFELKWNKSAQSAMEQITSKNYIDKAKEHAQSVLLVAVNYSADTKKHTCLIESV